MSYAAAKGFDRSIIPVIDIAPLRDAHDPTTVAEALHRASRDVGFIYVTDHGISETLIDQVRDAALQFSRLPEAQKQAAAISNKHRGSLAQGRTKMQAGAKADLKESFIFGYEDDDGITPDDQPLRGANRWPSSLPDLKQHARDYFSAAHKVAYHFMRGFALGLGKEPDIFLKTMATPISRAAFAYRQANERREGA